MGTMIRDGAIPKFGVAATIDRGSEGNARILSAFVVR